MHYILEITYILFYYLIILWIIKKWSFFNNCGISFQTLWVLFSIKFLFGIAIYYIYTIYYTDRKSADIFKYFDDAKYLYEHVYKISPIQFWKIIFGIQNESSQIQQILIKTNYWFKPFSNNVFNDNRTVIRFNAVIHLFSFGYYHVHTLILSILSFIGLTSLYKVFQNIFTNRKKELIISCFLIPSVLFWGSGILKESILLFAMGVFIHAFTQILYTNKKCLHFVIALLSIGLLAITKTYVLLILIPNIIAWIVTHYSKTSRIGLVFLCIHFGLIVVGFNAKKIDERLNIFENLRQKQKDFINVAHATSAGSTIQLDTLDRTPTSFVKTFPQALKNGLLRPTIFEIKNFLYAVSALENLFIILLLISTLLFFKKPTKAQLPLIYFGVFFSVFLATLIGWTVPVLGAIVRYKIPCSPFIYSVLLLCIDFHKIKNTLKVK